MVIRSDDAYRNMFLKEHAYYTLKEDGEGNKVPHKLTAEEVDELKKSGQPIRLGINGIFNDADAAGKYAAQHNTDGGPVYFLAFPKADTIIGELMIAGYQKFLENDFWGLTNSVVELKNISKTRGDKGLILDAHSRGAMTVGNAMESLEREGTKSVLTETKINFYGPAYNAQKAANMLYNLSDGKQDYVSLQSHKDDFVSIVLGNNPATHDGRRTGSSKVREWARIPVKKATVHSCYGGGNKICENAGYKDVQTKIIRANIK